LRTEFVDRAEVTIEGRRRQVGELLAYDRPLAQQLHEQCRVHTYGSFHIADLAA
jgi:S-adenosylmethionine-diacylglycerol 3-amino-3-carboxypropyl transferase